ncbi:Diaminopimelate epimerase [Botrimarina colliarenosi]|uniref:Diaminopimelate epimerase n=1 Tax=Botrimarina colliarenosi TaxID=2528001 RepID=A0A5C6AKI5_9BACT|nr:diaminopimelate epimerase [Botrimarina colliarenosi]TWT99768.1 Diaminopimelate epimerase [Botrimarina colliarenosi]
MRFTKMHGCGNDYVVVEALTGELAERFARAPIESAGDLAKATCDRRFGVGADGFVLILPETRPDSDAGVEMRMYNPDGSYSAMCGNALRCVAKRLADSGDLAGEVVVVRTADTLVPMRIVSRDADGKATVVEADLGAPEFAPEAIPCRLPAGPEGDLRAASIEDEGGARTATILSMGNPHCVLFVDEPPSDGLVASVGPPIETHAAFPERTNVEFVQVLSPTRLRQRTWERGAGETLACGSGACAVAVAAALTGRTERSVTIELLGGELDLCWREADGHVVMTGPAVEVFAGDWPR